MTRKDTRGNCDEVSKYLDDPDTIRAEIKYSLAVAVLEGEIQYPDQYNEYLKKMEDYIGVITNGINK